MSSYNPYDLVTVRIEGEEIGGRPYQFDSEPANQQTMQNSFGNYVKPTHISTVCPKCGQGVMIENIQLPDPPFPVIDWVCQHCRPGVEPPVNAFMNPLEAGRIAEHEFDPLLHNPMEQVVEGNPDETVADRLIQETVVGHTTSALLANDDEPKPTKTAKKATKKATKKTKKKTAKKETAKKAPESQEKRSPIKGASMSQSAEKAQPEPKETPSLVTETPPKKELEAAEGLSEEFDDDDLVENE